MRFLSLVVSFIFIALQVQAAPVLQPALMQMLRAEGNTNRMVTVFLTHKDRLSLRREMRWQKSALQKELMRNADISQAETLQRLQGSRAEGAPLAVRRYWINNTLMVTGPLRVIAPLLNSDAIVSARLNTLIRLKRPYFHGRVGRSADQFTYGLKKIGVPELRARRTDLDGRGVRIGIIDSGIDANHPDLRGKVLLFKDFTEANRPTPYDDDGHGTHVAGTIAGGSASGTAIGVAPGAKLIIAKIFDANGSTSDEKVMEAMQWVVDPDGNPETNDGAQLVSNSWGDDEPLPGNPADFPECKTLVNWVAMGVLPVFAAGNSGPGRSTVDRPGSCPTSFTVGATDQSDRVASFSSRGPVVWNGGSMIKPNVSAPGVGVMSAAPGGGYVSLSGTSMATPHVAGVAALLYQLNPQADPATIGRLIIKGSLDLGAPGEDPDSGWGRVDITRSIEAALNWH